jgi:hypothetical protein
MRSSEAAMSGTLDEISHSRQPRDNLSALVAEAAEHLAGLDDPAFGRLFDRYAEDTRVAERLLRLGAPTPIHLPILAAPSPFM